MEAVAFAKSVGLPLVAHLTVHWSLTDVGDDPNGKLFAKLREGLDEWLNRRGVFAGAWARERQCGGQSDMEHCHLLFHLPVTYHYTQVGSGPIPTASISSKAVVRRCGISFTFTGNIAACRASFTASVAAPRRTSVRQGAEVQPRGLKQALSKMSERAKFGLHGVKCGRLV